MDPINNRLKSIIDYYNKHNPIYKKDKTKTNHNHNGK